MQLTGLSLLLRLHSSASIVMPSFKLLVALGNWLKNLTNVEGENLCCL